MISLLPVSLLGSSFEHNNQRYEAVIYAPEHYDENKQNGGVNRKKMMSVCS